MNHRVTNKQIQRRLDALDAWGAGRSPQPDAYDEQWEYDLLSDLRDLREAVRQAMNNIGVPQSGYPAPVAEAYSLLKLFVGNEGDHE